MKCSYKDLLSILKIAITKAPAIITIMRPSSPDGHVSIYLDDYEEDRRYVVQHYLDREHCTVTTICGYDANKHCWTKEIGRERIQFANQRDRKKFVERLKQLATEKTGHPNPDVCSIYVN